MSFTSKPSPRARRVQALISEGLLYVSLALFASIVLFPYLWMVLASFKPSAEIFTAHARLLPVQWTLDNYRVVLAQDVFLRSIFNSVIVTLCGVCLEVVTAFLGAYAFAKLDFWGKDFLFAFILGTMMIPPQVLMLPSYLLITQLGWQDTYAGLTIPRAGAAFAIFLLRQFMLTVPQELDDAAQIDGAGVLMRMISLYVPVCLPSIVTVAVFSMLGFWNDYYWPLVVTSDRQMRTVALGIAQFKNLEGMGNWELIMAAAILATLPMLVVYIFARKTLIENLTAGALHGR
ncbi:MAG: carbohydrate ABC transporter permease [Chloroflexi bacterium]|nr:carbohydrate ABC transporter permease [Chloroflexota bacterium]